MQNNPWRAFPDKVHNFSKDYVKLYVIGLKTPFQHKKSKLICNDNK